VLIAIAAAAMNAKNLELFIVLIFRVIDCANNQPFTVKKLGRAGKWCRLSPINRLSTGGRSPRIFARMLDL